MDYFIGTMFVIIFAAWVFEGYQIVKECLS